MNRNIYKCNYEHVHTLQKYINTNAWRKRTTKLYSVVWLRKKNTQFTTDQVYNSFILNVDSQTLWVVNNIRRTDIYANVWIKLLGSIIHPHKLCTTRRNYKTIMKIWIRGETRAIVKMECFQTLTKMSIKMPFKDHFISFIELITVITS